MASATASLPSSTPNDLEEQQQILALLCSEAPSDIIRDCLRKYDPKKPIWQVENQFKQERKQTLVDTLAYLGVPDMGQYRADILPSELNCRIQNLLPDDCHLCQSSYCIKLTDKPIISCARCGQGCHNKCVLQLLGLTVDDLNEDNEYGLAAVNPFAELGMTYLCGFCKKAVIPQLDEMKVKAGGKKKSPPEIPSQSQETTVLETTDSVPLAHVSNDSVSESDPNVNDQPDGSQRTPSQANNVNDQPDGSQSSPSQANNAPRNRGRVLRTQPQTSAISTTPQKPDCKFLKQGRCKHGISGKKYGICNFNHPKVCKRFITNGNIQGRGCSDSNQCKFFHPKLCHSSLKDRTCFNENCKYMHIKGTIRNSLHRPDGPQSRNSATSTSQVVQSRSTQPNERVSNPPSPDSNNEPFLEQFKAMSNQIMLITNKLQQLDTRLNGVYPTMNPPNSGRPQWLPPSMGLYPLHPQLLQHQTPLAPPAVALPPQ